MLIYCSEDAGNILILHYPTSFHSGTTSTAAAALDARIVLEINPRKDQV